MGVTGPLRDLTTIVERIDGDIGTVTGVDLPDRLTGEEELTATLDLEIPFGAYLEEEGALALRSAFVDDEGGIHFSFERADVLSSLGPAVTTELREATIDPDGTIAAVLDISLVAGETTGGGPANATIRRDRAREEPMAEARAPREGKRAGGEGGRGESTAPDRGRPATPSLARDGEPSSTEGGDRSVPPFRDTELLNEIYDSCETFAEMAEVIEMDVTPETVRRYMIDNGIHEPTSYDTDDDDREQSTAPVNSPDEPATATADSTDPVVLTDGIGLTRDVDVDTLVEAVRNSRTIYEVTQQLGLDRRDTVETLREYDLLDLVSGRLAADDRSEVTRGEIIERLREVSAAN